jgi:HNH endonuclease
MARCCPHWRFCTSRVLLPANTPLYVHRFYKGVCQYCGENGYEWDHIAPKRLDGPRYRCISNVVAACYRCNRSKSAWPLVKEQHEIAVALATFVAPAIIRMMNWGRFPSPFPFMSELPSADHLPRPKLILDKSDPWFRPARWRKRRPEER